MNEYTYVLGGEASVLASDTEPEEKTLIMPPGILDSETWRTRVRALLAVAGTEGMLVLEVWTALKTNHGETLDWARVEKWLEAELAAGAVCTERDFWYLAGFADVVKGAAVRDADNNIPNGLESSAEVPPRRGWRFLKLTRSRKQ